MANIYDVAKRAGVSVATVSRYIRGHPVRPDNAEGIAQAIAELDYRPSSAARALITKRTGVVGMVVPNIANAFYSEVFRGFHDCLLASNYQVILANSDRVLHQETQIIDSLVRLGVEGLALVPLASEEGLGSEAQLASIRRLQRIQNSGGVPVVAITECIPYQEAFDTVSVDGREAAYMATRHLLRTGREGIALLGGNPEADAVRRRIDGYRQAMIEYGLSPLSLIHYPGGTDRESGYRLMTDVLREQPKINAVLGVNDQIALGALMFLEDHEISIPEQMAVMGIDDVAETRIVRPRLSTVAQPQYEIGYEAGRLLLARINQEVDTDGPVCRTLPIRLKVRESTWEVSQSFVEPKPEPMSIHEHDG
ncbi:MAG: LacI family DNA-binding transcriptional regulator [Firmicutes bacterium]|nr:LacI family DNA-binding transcriptional regulator [Bacillota bacterium]